MDTMEEEEVVEKPKVCFGSGADREIFPSHVPHTRFGNNMVAIRGQPNTGPGCYNNEEQTNFQYAVDHHLSSEKGYTLGARTANRFPKGIITDAPPPTTYQEGVTDPMTFETCKKPFHSSTTRFSVTKREIAETCPGAGQYEHEFDRNRHVQWQQSLGGGPINLPSVQQQSTVPKNTEKLLSTKEEKKYYRRLAYLKLYY